MRELVRTTDPVLLSFLEALLRDAGIEPMIADQHMSMLEGSLGILPQRLLVPTDSWQRAAHILRQSDLAQWIVQDGG